MKAKDGGKEKKHCHAFDFGRGTCRFGAECRYLHDKGSGDAKAEPFSPEQKKLVTLSMFFRALLDIRFLSSLSFSTPSGVAAQNATAPRRTDASTFASRQLNERSTVRLAFASLL